MLLGIDVGTTGVRAAALDASGRTLADASEPCPFESPRAGWAEIDPLAWWRAVGAACRRVGQAVPLERVQAVGVTGQAPTAVCVDGAGQVLRKAILWLDVRADREARAIDAALGEGRAEAYGGNRMHAYYLGPKLAWLRTNEPDVLCRTRWVLQSHAFVVFRLTGRATVEASTAMLSSPLFDARSGVWSEEGLRATGIAAEILPPISRSTDVAGVVTHDAARESGLPEGTPVVAAGGDFAASALGAGVFEDGEACLMLGTAGNLLMPRDTPLFDGRLINSHHVGCERWLSLGGTLCGAALEWFRAAAAPDGTWETLEREAAAVSPAELGDLLCLPYLQGERTPLWDETVRGAFVGIDLTHKRGHLYRALLEGVALGYRDCLSVAEEHGARFDEVTAANGAGRSALLRQTLADALGVPLTWTPGADARGTSATVLGAALVA
ncbi:MAG: hypothetical protein JOZ69_22090, partial [Myxococcales bacterium]|nr:hypothetical protein [Myxococcales bacterium]